MAYSVASLSSVLTPAILLCSLGTAGWATVVARKAPSRMAKSFLSASVLLGVGTFLGAVPTSTAAQPGPEATSYVWLSLAAIVLNGYGVLLVSMEVRAKAASAAPPPAVQDKTLEPSEPPEPAQKPSPAMTAMASLCADDEPGFTSQRDRRRHQRTPAEGEVAITVLTPKRMQLKGQLTDVSEMGAGLLVPQPIAIGARVEIRSSEGTVVCEVRNWLAGYQGFRVGLRFIPAVQCIPSGPELNAKFSSGPELPAA